MYITSKDELLASLETRYARRAEIRERTATFLLKKYGIACAPDILPAPIQAEAEQKPVAILARQTASICVEDISFEIGSSLLNMRPVTLTLMRDAFTPDNHDKLCRVEIPWLSWCRNGSREIVYERLSAVSNQELVGTPLMNIACKNGKKLPALHKSLRASAYLEGIAYDCSRVHNTMLHTAARKPSFVYRLEGDREYRCELTADTDIKTSDRPPSSWYYPYYLSWFVDGTSVLFETYDNELGGVPEARRLFESSMHSVYEATGVMPLIVKIPPLSKEMLWCNRHFMWRHSALQDIKDTLLTNDIQDTVSFFARIAENVIAYR